MQISALRQSLRVVVGIPVLFLLVITSVSQACLWDWDTLQMERRRFPGTLEMITGKFVRHSPAYYEWRIQDRSKRIRSPAEDPDLADDLAVAYSKLGRHAEGIALLEQVLAAHPDRYETLANLGTIQMLAGNLKVGKEYIEQAIVVNPNAHFGREKYQSLLAEYFLKKKKSPHPASEWPNVVHLKQICGFAEFVLAKQGLQSQQLTGEPSKEAEAIKAELAAAQLGVLGMMHFANYDSPLLLEALGDLLMAWPARSDDALQLAARAYFRVAQVSDDAKSKDEFQKAGANMVFGHVDYINHRKTIPHESSSEGPGAEADLEKLSTDLNRELAEAKTYFDAIAADEQRWIAEGVDVDKAFAARYYDSLDRTIEEAKKQLASERRDVRSGPHDDAIRRALQFLGAIAAGLVALILGAVVTYRRLRARHGKRNGQAAE